jgi:hypothetical protein
MLKRDELPEVAERFMSGTTAEVLPVVRVDGKPVGDGQPRAGDAPLAGGVRRGGAGVACFGDVTSGRRGRAALD